jgi:Protein of unknown function (DUF3575).
MYKSFITLLIVFAIGGTFQMNGQTLPAEGSAYLSPKFAVKSNLLYNATTTLNFGVEFVVGGKTTLDFPVNYNPWTFSENRKWKNLIVQPELRWWTCERFNGNFWGLHAHYGIYNVGNIPSLPIINNDEDIRYQGWLVGAGISYGYNIILSPRWGLEFTIGVGYVYTKYDRYKCGTCGEYIDSEAKHYFGPTKAGISLIYLIK